MTNAGNFVFEGIPDGIGIRPGGAPHTIDVYVAHEQSTIPFLGARDFEDSSISKLTIETKAGARQGSVLAASVALPASAGFLRFCSANMAGPAQGLDSYVFFTGEETNDVVNGVQRGYAVVLDTDTGAYTAVPGLGRLNHENTMVIPGGWEGLSMLTTDDTFNAPSSQLYMYRAADQSALFADEGDLYAFRVTGTDGSPLADPTSAFNGANDYLDLDVGESFQGEFIPVPAQRGARRSDRARELVQRQQRVPGDPPGGPRLRQERSSNRLHRRHRRNSALVPNGATGRPGSWRQRNRRFRGPRPDLQDGAER